MTLSKPPLKLLPSTLIGTEPARSLAAPGRALWDRIMAEVQIDDAGGRELLLQICGTVDLIETLAARVKQDGEVLVTRSGLKAHPALRDLLAARSFVARGLARLGLNLEPLRTPGRPPGDWSV
jgi:hypothetical protein